MRLTVQLEDATKHISDILGQGGREASLRIKTEAKLAEVRTERDGLAAQIQIAREALEIVAGKRQCIDNLMGNQEVAQAALALLPSQPKEPPK
jgi:hypothetical protein